MRGELTQAVKDLEWKADPLALVSGMTFILTLIAVGLYLSNYPNPTESFEAYLVLFVSLSVGSLNGHYLGKATLSDSESMESFMLGVFSILSIILIGYSGLSILVTVDLVPMPSVPYQVLVVVLSAVTLFTVQASDLVEDSRILGRYLWIFWGIIPTLAILGWVVLTYVVPFVGTLDFLSGG